MPLVTATVVTQTSRAYCRSMCSANMHDLRQAPTGEGHSAHRLAWKINERSTFKSSMICILGINQKKSVRQKKERVMEWLSILALLSSAQEGPHCRQRSN